MKRILSLRLNLNLYLSACLLFLLGACKRNFEAPVPSVLWDAFENPAARALPPASRGRMEGLYNFVTGNETFGNAAALKWSYTAVNRDTTWHCSLFCGEQTIFFVLEGKQLNGDILLNGYWRKKTNTETGKVHLTLKAADGAAALLKDSTPGRIALTGVFGLQEEAPTTPLALQFNRRLRTNTGFEILAHRGGGRNADLLPASENSVEMLRLAARLGATGVEIDVHQTKDGELVLYHDETLNERLIVKNGMIGPIDNYTYAQLFALVQLKRGGKIPTLRQALQTILDETPLRFVWIDTKLKGSLTSLRSLQQEFLQKAAQSGRNLQIVIGIPDETVLGNFRQLPNYQNIPSLVELGREVAVSVNAKVWAPTWTLGLQNDEVQQMLAQGRRAFVWTLDSPERIQQYLNESSFNGILSNQASAVAYYFYAKQ